MSTQYQSLSEYFPVIRTRADILNEITQNQNLKSVFNSWNLRQQHVFLDICTGTRGVKMLYDSYFKEILNPESKPERLSRLLSVILGQKVTVKNQLSNDNSRIGDELSLVITDIVVELEDGTIANIEVQKIGYMFLGERASCYVADLLLRQYKRVRELSSEKNIPFSYRDIPPVYTIVFMESSPSVFKDYPDVLIHTFRSVSASGLELNMLQNVVFIPIDIFLGKLHNEGINSEFEAWLTFLGCDEPQYIIELINKYPFFKDMYQDLYDMCLNVERVINMFSKELQELDHNTVIYMMDEYQEQLNDIKSQLDVAQNQLDDTKNQLDDTKNQLDDTKNQLDSANTIIADRDFAIAEMSIIIQKYKDKFGEI